MTVDDRIVQLVKENEELKRQASEAYDIIRTEQQSNQRMKASLQEIEALLKPKYSSVMTREERLIYGKAQRGLYGTADMRR